MRDTPSKSVIEAAAARLREIVRDQPEGALIGSEEALLAVLGCSRSTVRQVARLLEREGLLRVKRGINGGYFGARPDAGTIEQTIATYLETLRLEPDDVTVVASVLWVEVMRRAAAADDAILRAAVEALRPRVQAVPATACFPDVRDVEQESRRAIFALADMRYIELIFDINTAFASRSFGPRAEIDEAEQRAFVRAWRDAKLMELTAIAERDVELAAMAARQVRSVWNRRVWQR